jgi:hypothetical protein
MHRSFPFILRRGARVLALTPERSRTVRWRRALAILPIAATALAGCAVAANDGAEATGLERQDLYGLGSIGTPWPGGQVPVCYQNLNDHPELQALIPGILGGSWSRAANINFTGFGSCSGGNEVSVAFAAATNYRGNTSSLGYGNPTVTLISDDALPNRAHFTYEVIHEFGHALGFAHEMKRPDNWNGANPQCTVPPSSSDYGNYAPQGGGLYLTANYDPNSIMNYCDPQKNQTTQLSVGDILAVSSPNAYGSNGACVFQDAATKCSWTQNLHAEETYSVPYFCSPTTGWTLQWLSPGGGTVNLPNSCTDGQPAGLCPPNAQNGTSFVLGYQAEGAVQAGPIIGSTQTVQMCDAFNNCSPLFHLTVSDCSTAADQLFLNPNQAPLQIIQNGGGWMYVLMTGPWVENDHGNNAAGTVENNPIPSSTVWMDPGTDIDGEGAVELNVYTTMATPPGSYSVRVRVTDQATQVTRTAEIPVQVLPCTPSPISEACTGSAAPACGLRSVGCEMVVDCGSCASGSTCQSGNCCPIGTTWDGSQCAPPPPTCPPATPLCANTNTCLPPTKCALVGGKGGGGGCRGTTCM